MERSAQYQSFPDVVGASRTVDKLKALMLPLAPGVSFLDVGCNEGFFCGFARHVGAGRVLGLDISAGYVARARERFPDCEFRVGSWDTLPDETFDIILLASALHYAQDQEALIHSLVERLSPSGVLVLELGIVSSRQKQWSKVARGDDERVFPSMPMLSEVLAPYAWKWMGPSVAQAGDPVPRHVVHVHRRRPMAYLLLEPPGSGKSTIAGSLFAGSATPVLSNDEILRRVGKGEIFASAELTARVSDEFSPFGVDRLIARVVSDGLIGDLVAVWLEQAKGGDFVMEGFLPASEHGSVQQALTDAGYLPVRISWDRIGRLPMPPDLLQAQAEAYYRGMVGEAPLGPEFSPPAVLTGFVDDVVIEPTRLGIRGWAVDPSGELPRMLAVRIGASEQRLESFAHEQRPDVQRHFHLRHDLVGFRATLEWPAGEPADPASVQVFGGADGDSLVGPFTRRSAK